MFQNKKTINNWSNLGFNFFILTFTLEQSHLQTNSHTFIQFHTPIIHTNGKRKETGRKKRRKHKMKWSEI